MIKFLNNVKFCISILFNICYNVYMNSEVYKNLTSNDFVFNICHFDNIKSILENGILSYKNARSIKHKSIAIDEIQERREKKRVPNGLFLHEYANCFFNPRNSMLYSKQADFGSIAIICVSAKVLDLPDVVVSDMNAATNIAAFYPVEMGLNRLNFDKIFTVNWNLPDDSEKARLKSIVSAEVLVPYKIEVNYIKEIKVYSDSSKKNLEALLGCNIKITVDPYLFFR